MTNPPMYIGAKAQLIVPPHKFGDWSEIVDSFKLKVELKSNNLQRFEIILFYLIF